MRRGRRRLRWTFCVKPCVAELRKPVEATLLAFLVGHVVMQNADFEVVFYVASNMKIYAIRNLPCH